MDWTALLTLYGSLLGFAAVITWLINAGKTFGLIQDGQAPLFNVVLNLIGLVVLVVLKYVNPDVDIAAIDSQAAEFAKVAVIVLGYVVQIGGTKLFHNIFKGTPLIGKSFSD